MKITDIIPDFSKMSDSEVEAVIRDTRRSRTTVKQVSVTKRPAKAAAKAKDSVSKVIGSLSDAEKAALRKLFS